MRIKTDLQQYRKGAVGALADEYERAVDELKSIIAGISEFDYTRIGDPDTSNEECRSIQTMMSHVVDSGYAYANDIRPLFSLVVINYDLVLIPHNVFALEIDKMLAYTFASLEGKWELSYPEMDEIVYISSGGYRQDLEQILEHAIVHILRHRRQTEKFLLTFKAQS